MSDTKKTGPIYGVELIDSLPIPDSEWTQAMPSRCDLEGVDGDLDGQRVVAGYEVLLSHWRQNKAEVERLTTLCQNLVGEETLHQEGQYETEMMRLKAENERLRAALEPFAAVAKGIPRNWPGQCRLRIDEREDGSEYLSYHGDTIGFGTLPKIDEWYAADM